MAGFKVDEFRGIRPRRSALKLGEGEAQTASDTKLGSGDLKPWVDKDIGELTFKPTFVNTIHRFDNDGDPIWFEFNFDVSVARGTIKGDDLERTYYTGDTYPKMTFIGIAETGNGPYPGGFRRLGIPAPVIPPTVVGQALPETVPSDERRTSPNTMLTNRFEIVFVNYTVYPGGGGETALWSAGLDDTGDITFDLQAGDAIKVLEVLDEDTVKLGSATGTGAFSSTAANDKTVDKYWSPQDNTGSTREADFTGWRIPDGLEVTIVGHKLRVGDVMRVTRTDFSEGLLFPFDNTQPFYEQSWAAAVEVTIDAETFFQAPNARVSNDAAGDTNFPALSGGFYYDIDRAASTSDILQDRSYVYTFVSSLGEEGPPSPASDVVLALNGDTMTVTGIETPPGILYDITEIRLYRTNATLAGTEFQFVKKFSVANNTTENVFDADLGEVITTVTWEAPPATMQGITSMPNGMMVGFVGKTIHFSEPYFPHAWPPEYDQAIDYNIVGLAAFGNSVAVLTEGIPYILTGAHPRNANIRPFAINQACVSAASIAATKDRVIYASPDGLIEIGVNGASIITEGYVRKGEWADFVPETIVGEIHDGKYFGFFDAPSNVSQPVGTIFLTGTVVDVISLPFETDIVAGSETIILTLVGDTFLDAGVPFDDSRQFFIDALLSGGDFVTGWEEVVRPNIPVTDVARISSTQVTITLTAQTAYSIIADETITLIVPGETLTNGLPIPADVPFIIQALEDYSSEVVAVTEKDATEEVPFSINSGLDILDWDSYSNVGTSFKGETDFISIAYSPSLDRYCAVGQREIGAPVLPGYTVVSTSDNRGADWTERNSIGAGRPSSILWYEEFELFIMCGNNLMLRTSTDGESFPFSGIVRIRGGRVDSELVSLVIGDSGQGGAGSFVYAAYLDQDFLIQSQDLQLFPVTNSWDQIDIVYSAAVGTKFLATGGGKILYVGNDDTDMDIGELEHGAAGPGVSIGVISTYNARGLILGDDLWVAVSDDFRIVTCANGDEGTIGNWSAPGSAEFANTDVRGIVFDQGDTITRGYGFIVFGQDTGSNKGVIYTSPDAVTWTLRHTQLEDIAITAMAVKFPEDQRDNVLVDFSPTFNGAQFPSQVGFSSGSWEFFGFKGKAEGIASTEVTVLLTGNDAVVNMVGTLVTRGGSLTGSTPLASTDIFNLNERPDEIRFSAIAHSPGSSDKPADSSVATIQPWVEDQFFSPVSFIKYGFAASCRAFAFVFDPDPGENTDNESIVSAQITFRKSGFNDLTIHYEVQADAHAQSGL